MKIFSFMLLSAGLSYGAEAKWGINRVGGHEVTLSKYNTRPFDKVVVHPKPPDIPQAYGVMVTLKWRGKPLLVSLKVRQKEGNDLDFNYTFIESPGEYATTVLFTPLECESVLSLDVTEVLLLNRSQ